MRWCVVILIFTVISLGSAQEESLQFEQANQLYRNGSYAPAAGMYEQVVANGFESPSLYYNLGNAYFKLKNIPAAILNYERAKRLAPHDEDIAYNHRLANLRVIDKIDSVPQLFLIDWWNTFVGFLSSAGWATLLLSALWCCVGCVALFLFMSSSFVRRVAILGGLLSLLVALTSCVATVRQLQHEQHEQAAVVFAQSVSVKSAPDVQSTDLFVVHEGVKVDVLDAVGEWRKIRLADGKMGWMQGDGLQAI